MDPKIIEIQKLLDAADASLSSARTMMREITTTAVEPLDMDKKLENLAVTDEGKVIEGVFDGESMVGPDGQTYPIPPNYASKSKLVEGDTLKLTIPADGSFVFKQIAPVERRSTVGTLALDGNNYTISAEGKSYKVLTASVTFYKAEPGDQITIILPKDHDAVWAVVENVIKKPEVTTESTLPVIPEVAEESTIVPEETLSQGETVIPVPVQEDNSKLMGPRNTDMPVSETPQIEFPAGASGITDEQLLENLKNNLKTLDQPAFTPPENVAAKPVDNIVATDMGQIPTTPAPTTPASDVPISELDI